MGLVISALLGAVAAGLAWLAVRRWGGARAKNNPLVPSLAAVIAVVAVTTGAAPMLKARKARSEARATGLALYGNARAADTFADLMAPLMARPDLDQRLQAFRHPGGSPTGFAELVHAGTSRLDTGDLEALFGAKRAIAALSPEMCSGFWTGAFSTGALNEALRHLDERAQVAWITVSMRAADLELHATSPEPRMPLLTVTRAMMRLRDAMPPEDSAAFERASNAEVVGASDACQAFQALANAVTKLPADMRETIIRSTTNPEVVEGATLQ